MGKKRVILFVVLVIGILAGLARLTFRQNQLVYHGRSATSWLNDLEEWDGDTNHAAFAAFREMGTNVIPTLLDALKSKGSPLQRSLFELNRKQSVVHVPVNAPWQHSLAASWALYAMGTNARPALSALTNLLFNTNEVITSATALAGIGSDAVPALLMALTNQNNRIRHAAASGLGWERGNFDVVVPALIARLKDSDRLVHISTVSSMGQMHARSDLAVPALINDFPGNDSLLRSSILISLGLFEGRAKEALPIIKTAVSDGDQSVRDCAAFALKQIDPEAAAKAGIK